MTVKKAKPATIAEYIAATPAAERKKLKQLHTAIRAAAPGAEEGLKWNMPAYSLDKILVSFALYKNHIGFAPMPSAIKAFAKELATYKTSSGSVQFPLDKPLPINLVKKIVKFRVKENNDGTIKWKS
ncbi:MAG: DUF1801 domain-containing protein [Chitinophagaceae bacterium]